MLEPINNIYQFEAAQKIETSRKQKLTTRDIDKMS